MSVSSSQAKKIGVVHPYLRLGGGSESRALWTAEALKDHFDVSLITMGTPDLEKLNDYYRTNINRVEISIISFPIPLLFKTHFDALRSFKLARYCKKKSDRYDLMISTYNTMSFGRRGLQFIADFSFSDTLRRRLHPETKGIKKFAHRPSLFRRIYLWMAGVLAGGTEGSWLMNQTVTNSNWSRKLLKNEFGIESETVYPPVLMNFPDIPWGRREQGFVFLGRLVPEKRVDKIIEIMKEVRGYGYDIHLHIYGKIQKTKYVKHLQRLCNANRPWCTLEGEVFGERKVQIIAGHRFGISACENEAFGIAVAEMVRGGSLVFVPNGGGQIEIVDHPSLIYNDTQQAVQKIKDVLDDPDLQQQLRIHLGKHSEKFSVQKFQTEVKSLVQNFFSS